MNTALHKKIIIPIYNGTRARNFFRNDTYRELIKDRSITLVVAIPSVKLDFYTKEFQEPNLIFEPFDFSFVVIGHQDIAISGIDAEPSNTAVSREPLERSCF